MFEELTENLLETPLVTNGDFLSLLSAFFIIRKVEGVTITLRSHLSV